MDPELLDLLRRDLEAADFRVVSVAGMLGAPADAARQRGVFAPARSVLDERGPSPLATLTRLFLLGEPVSTAALDTALPGARAAGAAALGLVAAVDGSCRATLSVNPVRIDIAGEPVAGRHSAGERDAADWWVISDLDDQLRRGPARTDHVMGVGGATRSLIAQAPLARLSRADSALDLGTGCGIVALVLARAGARRVVATDISERALTLARANARLNGVHRSDGSDGAPASEERIEFRRGDLFEPVEGERFDLILSNPPFVITPRGAAVGDGAALPVYEYRDGGMVGDALAAAVVRQGPAHLAPGGTLLCLANWESPWGENGLERVRGWVADAAGDSGALAAWIMERDRVDPAQYAETWARDGGARPGEAAFEELMAAWLEDFARRRIIAVGLGSIRIRRLPARRPGTRSPVLHLDRAAGALATEGLGSLFAETFDAGIAADCQGDDEVLAGRWVRDDAVVEERGYEPGAESPRSIVLRTDRPVARRVTADPLLAAAVGACDGELTLAQIADALATLLEVDSGAAAEALVAGVRELVWLGMLAPAGQQGAAVRSLE